MVTRIVRWLPALVWMGVLFYWSHQPVLPIDQFAQRGALHTLSHIGAYAVLGWAFALAIGQHRRGLWIAWLLATLYGAGDEIHQSFVPGRGAFAWQVGLDSVAAAGGLLLVGDWRHLGRRMTRPA